MKKHKLRFFLDYGICFWGADDDEGFSSGLTAEELPLSPEARQQVTQFLNEYHQHYSWGCPPSESWTIEDCKRFNRECERILNLVMPELGNQFLICNEQFDLLEDAELLADFNRRGRKFIEARKINYYHWSDAYV